MGREPYTIQLRYGSSGYVQPVEMGIDAGYAKSAFRRSATEELLGGEMTLLEGMSERRKERAMYRRKRRSRRRHRQPRRTPTPAGRLASALDPAQAGQSHPAGTEAQGDLADTG